MPPKSQNESRQIGPYRCRFCPAVLRDKTAPEAQGWDWVTGHLPATEHCCPACLGKNSAMWQEIVRRAAITATRKDAHHD